MRLPIAVFCSRRITHRKCRSTGLIAALLAGLVIPGGAQADAHRHELEHRADTARSRATESGRSADSLAARIESDSNQIDALEVTIAGAGTELANLREQLSQSRSRLVTLEEKLRQTADELSFARRQLKIGQDRLAERVVALYTSSEPDAVTILLGAESLEEAIEGIELQDRAITQDRELVAQVERERTRLTGAHRRIGALRRAQAAETSLIARRTADRQATLSALVSQRRSIVALRAQRKQSLAAIEVARDDWEQQAEALATQSARLASVSSASPAAVTPAQPAANPSGGAFIWPVRGAVVSPYGQRWGRLHSGIDIAAPVGTAIAASAAGQVVFSGSMSGYGNLVVIQHPGGIATAYAHNSSNAVAVGQSVGQSQTIGNVGCTGHCFGDHVHFEIRVNGTPVDPAAYL